MGAHMQHAHGMPVLSPAAQDTQRRQGLECPGPLVRPAAPGLARLGRASGGLCILDGLGWPTQELPRAERWGARRLPTH